MREKLLKCNCGRNYKFDESKIIGHCDYCIEVCKKCGRQLDIVRNPINDNELKSKIAN